MRVNLTDQRTPRFRVLSEDQIEMIYSAALEVLERTGGRVFHEEALKLFKQSDAVVSDGNKVRIQASMVERALKDHPRKITLAGRDGRRSVHLDKDVNPHYAHDAGRLRTEVLRPVLGADRGTISREQWRRIRQFFAAHEAWAAAKTGAAVEPIGPDALREYLKEKYRSEVESLISRSAAAAIELDDIRLTEKLILYQAYLLALAIHCAGRAIVWSGSKEVAELKRDQVRGAGPDFYAARKVDFPLGVTIEPLPG